MENVYISQSKGLCDAIEANEGLSIKGWVNNQVNIHGQEL